MIKEPMLAAKTEPEPGKAPAGLQYPVIVSPKLDGIRALVIGGQLVSRKFLPIPNEAAQAAFAGLPEGTDGELIFGTPFREPSEAVNQPYNRTQRQVSRRSGLMPTYYVFDNFLAPGAFMARYAIVCKLQGVANVVVVPHIGVHNDQELLAYEEEQLAKGYEGVMIRSINGPYKQGRSTLNEGYLLKLKRFVDGEAEILDTTERMRNDNVASIDELGHTKRSSHQDNKTGHGDLGAFVVRGVNAGFKGVEFKVGTGLDAKQRVEFWAIREQLVGRIIKYSYFASGTLDRPRFPVFIGFRDKFDM